MRILTNGFPTNIPGSPVHSQGGPANFARLFSDYIGGLPGGHEMVSVFYKDGPVRHKEPVAVHSTPGHTHYCLAIPRGTFRRVTQALVWGDPAELLRTPLSQIGRFIREQNPDVLFLNGYGLFNWMLLHCAKEAGIPVVIQHAGIWTKELRLHGYRYSRAGRRIMEQMEKDSSELSSVEIFLNSWSRDYYRKRVAAGQARRTEIVPLPFDFNSFNQLSASAKRGRFSRFNKSKMHIGVIGRWDAIKNHDAVLAMAQAAKKNGLPWQFHAVVAIPDSEDKAKKRAYTDTVDVIEPLDREGISDFCRSVDLLVMPSLFDVSPTVVLEAMALDTPIAVSPTVGFAPVFAAHGARSWVINPSDADKAVGRISRILGKKIPPALREKIISMHDHARVFDTYLQIFEEAHLRTMPVWQVVKVIFWREVARYFAKPEASSAYASSATL
ncbi:MAG: glycosyltransferase family 4 protein [Candidatus Pacebacteria bacterium]|nr:glycosyltransferase family 4 protein [Candidatus Paceibacterota bacterium]